MREEGTRADAAWRDRIVPGTDANAGGRLTVGEAADTCAWGLHVARTQAQLALDALDHRNFKAASAAFQEAANQVMRVTYVCECARDGGAPADAR